MWTRWLACLTLAGAPSALAEPRIPGMDAQLEADMARADYLFVWDIDRRTLGRGDPYRTMRTYYDALMYALSEERRLIEPGTPSTVKLEPMAPHPDWDEAYSGRLRSRETYLEGDPVELHFELTRRDCDSRRSQLIFALSRAPRTGPAWREMRITRDNLSCDKSKTR